jgi:glycerol uptake facilitator-like aquaporin
MSDITSSENEGYAFAMAGEALALGAFAAIWIVLVAATGWTAIIHTSIPVTLQALMLAGATAFLMLTFRDMSGGHLNPVMTLATGLAGRQHWRASVGYSIAHIAGALGGIAIGYAFATAQPIFPLTEARVIAEFLGAAVVINAVVALRNEAPVDAALGTGAAVALVYWISGGETLANPALTLAQGLFGLGIDTIQAGPIVAAQLLGGFTGYYVARLLWP